MPLAFYPVTSISKTYLPEPLLAAIEIADFKYEASEYAALMGKLFQVIFVHARPESLPFVAQRGTTGLRAGAIYVRREGQTEEASYDEVQNLIRQKLAATPQTEEARGMFSLDLPKVRVRMKVAGVNTDAGIIATRLFLEELFAQEEPFEFASDHPKALVNYNWVNRRTRSGPLPQGASLPLTDHEWEVISHYFAPKSGGYERTVPLRQLVEAIRNKLAMNVPWRKNDWPKNITWNNAQFHYRKWCANGTWAAATAHLVELGISPLSPHRR